MDMQWILQESDRHEDDLLVESFDNFDLYAITEGGVSGYGVLKPNGEYWAFWELIHDKTTEEAKAINEAQYQEALRFGRGESIGQLSLL